MRNIKISLEYDGTNYSGWQIQKNTLKTIQYILQESLTKINKSKVKVIGAGRTDARVHALGQVANFKLDVLIPLERIPLALNQLLPSDIACKKAEEVRMNFHARYDACGKKYRYRILNQSQCSVFKRNYVYHFPYSLDLIAMKKAARVLEGVHNFSSFQASGSTVCNPVRRIDKIDLLNHDDEVWVEIWGNGFLYKMVRIIVGTLIEVGLGRIPADRMIEIIAAKNRNEAGFTAPAHGLTLVEVFYQKANCR